MQAIKENLMREICRPELLGEIKSRFNNLNSKTFRFGSAGEIRADAKGLAMMDVDKTTRTYIRYGAQGPDFTGPGHTCESITFYPSEFKQEFIAHRCYDAPFDARLYQETCKSYQTTAASSYLPAVAQTVGVIAGVGAALKAYQNFKAGNNGYGLGWVAIGVASIALPRIYFS